MTESSNRSRASDSDFGLSDKQIKELQQRFADKLEGADANSSGAIFNTDEVLHSDEVGCSARGAVLEDARNLANVPTGSDNREGDRQALPSEKHVSFRERLESIQQALVSDHANFLARRSPPASQVR